MGRKVASFGHVVKDLRRALKLTQTELARRVACATITIRKVEADGMHPSRQIVERLAMALDVSPQERPRFVQLARATALADSSPVPLPTPTPAPEEIGLPDLSGRAIRGYELGERLGTGGFGVVYRAVQPLVEREVAIKIVLPQYADHPDFIRRFEAEAQLVARLEHPYIVPLYDYWREPGVAYLVMRLLRGGSLEDRVRAGPLALEMVAVLLEQVGAALHAAHRAGVVHRDLKPANVLLDEDGNGYLADFGIAKDLNVEERTQVGTIVASPAYASPEQIRAEEVQPQADIYGLGLLLYELLAGEKPFPGPTPIDYIQQHLSAPLPSLAIQPGLDPLLRRATAKDPAERYPDVPSLLADLRRITASGGAVGLRPVPYVEGKETEIENPYKGLRAFTEADAADFYGQETLVQELLGSMAAADEEEEGARVPRELGRFLAVVGPSGCGKSSVVKAGLIPALRRGALPGSEQWFVVDMQPGAHPFEELEAALLRVAVNPLKSLLAQLREGERGLLRAVRRVLPADPGVELVLVIDQFEELFTLMADEAERAAFIAALVTAVVDPESRVRLVVTLRADFTDRPLQYVDLGELVRQRAVFVLPLTAEELEEAIVRPAVRVGLALEEGLAARIVQDVGEEPGVLPLLQYALTELFERRAGRTLTLAAYRESGGVSGALARRAEELYAGLGAGEQEAARQLFLRLVTLGEGSEDTRRRVLQAEVGALVGGGGAQEASGKGQVASNKGREARGRMPEAQPPSLSPAPCYLSLATCPSPMARVLALCGKHRLLTFDRDPLTRGPTVEVAHEALLREWGRLRGWLEESRGDVRLQRLLAAAAGEWERSGREPSYLMQGARLAQFSGWAAGSRVALTGGERAYLEASVAARGEREEEEKARREHELQTALQLAETEKARAEAEKQRAEEQQRRAEERDRAARRLRQRALWLAGALVVAAALAVLALFFGQAANRSAQEASISLNAAQTAQVRAVAEAGVRATAQAVAETQQGVAIAEAHARATQQAVAQGEARARATAEAEALTSLNHSEALRLAAESNRLRLQEANPELIALLALRSLRYKYTPQGDEASEGAARLAYATRIITSTSGEALCSLAWSPDGRYIASGSQGGSGTTFLWDATSGRQVYQLTGPSSWIPSTVFSPDSRHVASAGLDGTAWLWDVASGEEMGHFASAAYNVAFSPDGQYLATAVGETIRLWRVPTGEQVRTFAGAAAAVLGLAFSPDGRIVAAIDENRVVWLWETQTGELRKSFLSADTGTSPGLFFSPDGRTLLTAFYEGPVLLWDVSTALTPGAAGGAERQRFAHDSPISVNDLAISPDGRFLLVNTQDGVGHLWDVAAGKEVRRFVHPGQTYGAAFSPDGRTIATAEAGGEVRLWAAGAQGGLPQFPPQPGVNGMDLSPDGRTLATAGMDTTARLWDVQSGAELLILPHTAMVWEVDFSPDGQTLATAAWDGAAYLWDLRTGQELRQFTGHTSQPVYDITFSPDGRSLVTIGADATARMWDVTTGEPLLLINLPSWGYDVKFSPTGDTVLTGSTDGHLYLWDAQTGASQFTITVSAAKERVSGAAYSRDGRYITASGQDGTVFLWDAQTGAEVQRFVGHSLPNYRAVFSPDGRYLITASDDDTARVWDVTTGEQLRIFVHDDDIMGVEITPDGRIVATASWDGTVRLWYTDINDTIESLCGRLLRDLTAEEREQYGVGEGETCPLEVTR